MFVFFDIDGTLIDVSRDQLLPSKPVINSISALRQRGHLAFLASGRPLNFLDPRILNLGFDGLVLMNGALVTLGDDVIFSSPLDPGLVHSIVRDARDHAVEFILEGHPHCALPPNSPLMLRFYSSIGIDTSLFLTSDSLPNVYKLEFLAPEEVDPSALFSSWLQNPLLTGLFDPAHCSNLELYSRLVTKATGISKLLDHFGADPSQAFAFGDGLNDIDMLSFVNGLAMGNSSPQVKRAAKFVLPSVHDDGVAFGIHHFILGDSLYD